MSEPVPLVKMTANLVPRAVEAMEQARARTGDSRTDTINRALQVYALVLDLMDGRDHVVVVLPDGSVERVHIV